MSIVFDLTKGLTFQAVRFAFFKGTHKEIPDSMGLLVALGILSTLAVITEQVAREHHWTMILLTPTLFAVCVFVTAWSDGKIDRRMASSLLLISIPFGLAMAFTGIMPILETPVALWGGLAMLTVILKNKE